MGKKTYVVYAGREPGIYDSWGEASSNVVGHKGAVHQSFKDGGQAETAFTRYVENQSASTSFTSGGNKSSWASSGSKK
ncbi:proton pump-interactor 1-like [Dorcoceras hygrometricum]|uniref:Proton pump-interactor 1-like n=1 Tax=Dorcoceras hygrometricum TaxID=472368 RepID=A0A2Z7AY86_9LAMI|nr:proton pump-interactor 1-like [Dorcoceras hygrometricum]